MIYKLFLRPILFRISPEKAHYLTFDLLKMAIGHAFGRFFATCLYNFSNQNLNKQLFGLTFENPVGLAAGLDKNATHFNELSCLGFGFIEIGTLTPKPQPGNDKPRLFRLPKDNALIN
jgi:dihydroorotate dehydrogenase